MNLNYSRISTALGACIDLGLWIYIFRLFYQKVESRSEELWKINHIFFPYKQIIYPLKVFSAASQFLTQGYLASEDIFCVKIYTSEDIM